MRLTRPAVRGSLADVGAEPGAEAGTQQFDPPWTRKAWAWEGNSSPELLPMAI